MMPILKFTTDVISISRSIGALVWAVEGKGATEFLGTAFAIGREHAACMTAAHVVPNHLDRGSETLCVVFERDQLNWFTPVVEVEILDGQPDVALLRTEDRAPPLIGLAPHDVSMWETVFSAGHPEGIVAPGAAGPEPRLRGLMGTIQRVLIEGLDPGAQGPAWEVSFAIPGGFSGAPVFALGRTNGASTHGLVGVCLGSQPSRVATWLEDTVIAADLHGDQGEYEPKRAYQVVEYGLVARLSPFHSTMIDILDCTLEQLADISPGRAWAALEQ